MRNLIFLSLTQRIIGLIVAATVVGTVLISHHYETVLESAILDSVKKQALIYLDGLRDEVEPLLSPLDPAGLQALMEQRSRAQSEYLDFAILDLYLFDAEGRVLAHSDGLPRPDKEMTGYLGSVVNEGRPYLAEEIEEYRDPVDGRLRPKADVILPFRLASGERIALEVEIALDETKAMVRALDDRYEGQLWGLLALVTLVVVLFIGWVVHRGLIGPLLRVEQVTARIAAGELESRVTGSLGRDEFGRLGRAVNHMAQSLQDLLREQEEAFMQMLQSLTKALEAKDAYTAGHSGRVSRYAVRLARRLGFDEGQLQTLKRGALMHDLGKIGIPDAILNKPGPLTEGEYEIMQRHPVYTAAILRPLKRLRDYADIAAWHHERWDGAGYPDGLKGEAIPLAARIVAIADTWDAMTGDRVYRKGMPAEKAISILESERDSGQFEPRLLDEFSVMIRAELEGQRAVRHDMAGEGVATP